MDDLDVYLQAIVAGDPDAFGRWLAGAERPLRASLRSYAAALDTEAVLQESLLRVWQLAIRVVPDGEGNSLLRFAYRLTRNLAHSELRRRRAEPREIEELEREAERIGLASPATPDPLLRRVIEECRRALPLRPALALALRLDASGHESDAGLAAGAGMKLNTFLQNFGRARKLLAACLEAHGVKLDFG